MFLITDNFDLEFLYLFDHLHSSFSQDFAFFLFIFHYTYVICFISNAVLYLPLEKSEILEVVAQPLLIFLRKYLMWLLLLKLSYLCFVMLRATIRHFIGISIKKLTYITIMQIPKSRSFKKNVISFNIPNILSMFDNRCHPLLLFVA